MMYVLAKRLAKNVLGVAGAICLVLSMGMVPLQVAAASLRARDDPRYIVGNLATQLAHTAAFGSYNPGGTVRPVPQGPAGPQSPPQTLQRGRA